MDLCLVESRSPGSRVTKRWLYKDGLDLEGIRTASQEVERAEEV